MRISDWSSDVCSSDLQPHRLGVIAELRPAYRLPQLVHRPDTAGDGEEAVGEVGEHALSLVHPRDDMALGDAARSEERRVGTERVRTCRYRWSPYNSKTTDTIKKIANPH